jgi:predicted transposase/invertase (TIGR01784 family)
MFYGEYNREIDIAVKSREAWEDGLEEGLEQGLEQGREQGMEQEKIIIAKNLLAKGSTPEFVHDITGLSPEKIKELV